MKYNILKAQSGTKIPLSPRYKNYPKPKYQGEIKKDETSQLERSIDNLYRDKIKSTPIEGIIKTIIPSAAIASGAAAGPILTTAKGVATAAGYGALQGLGFGQLGMGSGDALNDAAYGAAGEVAGPLVGKVAGELFGNIGKSIKNFTNGKYVKKILGKDKQVFYHGSPFNFNKFDPSEIGTAEGASKGLKGINLSEDTRIAPKFANIKSEDAPIHLGKPRPTSKIVDPRIYTVKGNLKLKDIPSAKGVDQSELVRQGYDGVRIASPRQVTVFPESSDKLIINKKQTIKDFIKSHKKDEFAEWTTSPEKYE